MILGQAGESRVRGYLYVLERSLRTFLPKEIVADAVREVESHIKDRVAQVEPMPNERDALERVLNELGPPLRIAQAYAAEQTMEEAAATGRIVPIARAIFHVAATGLAGFAAAFGLLTGYLFGIGFILIAVLKPIFPNNTGLWIRDGGPVSFGTLSPAPTDAQLVGGYWVIPISLAIGLVILVATHRAARALVRRWRERRAVFSPRADQQ
jgi:uncharacterized membrane protein